MFSGLDARPHSVIGGSQKNMGATGKLATLSPRSKSAIFVLLLMMLCVDMRKICERALQNDLIPGVIAFLCYLRSSRSSEVGRAQIRIPKISSSR